MNQINKYSNVVPYLYFIVIILYLFTDANKSKGLIAYPILLVGIPFIGQLIKPNRKLNFALGITFVCLSSYLILAYLSDVFDIINFNTKTKQFVLIGGGFVISNFVMSLWIIRNSIKRTF
jgi:membrane-associated HD superfamily phosphohydrolase